jgi:hypothetical protein
VELLRGHTPKSVIVTGTAGDGKTYHCREAWLALGGSSSAWEQSEKLKHLDLGDGRELIVIRDLSEFQAADCEEWFVRIADDMLNPSPKRLYLIAANDGRLMDEWKAARTTPAVAIVREAIEDLLVTGQTSRTEVGLELVNLGRQSSAGMLSAVIDQIVNHPGWDSCSTCQFREPTASTSGCPIFENRRRLSGTADDNQLRHRLGELLELSERNGLHFPIRQLLLLVSNALLGHPDSEHGLLACKDVGKIVTAGTHDRANVYRNIFGGNVSPRRRDTTAVFDALSRFGIGNETSNRIDNILVYGSDDPELRGHFERLVLADRIYGGSPTFCALQRDYLENTEGRSAFLGALRTQRQRLFFVISNAEAKTLGVWDLTVFRYAGDYLELTARIASGQTAPQSALSPLIRGLNRVFTGLLVNNQDQLILASSGSHAQAKTSRLLEDTVPVPPRLGEGVSLRRNAKGDGAVLTVALGNIPAVPSIALPLTLLRYEFLCRVADGALPSSFSLACYEDFLAFKANILEAVNRRRLVTGDAIASEDTITLRFLRVGPDGRANPEPVEVTLS